MSLTIKSDNAVQAVSRGASHDIADIREMFPYIAEGSLESVRLVSYKGDLYDLDVFEEPSSAEVLKAGWTLISQPFDDEFTLVARFVSTVEGSEMVVLGEMVEADDEPDSAVSE